MTRDATPLPLRLVPLLRLALGGITVAIAALAYVIIPIVAWNDYQDEQGSTGEVLAMLGIIGLAIGLLSCVLVVIGCTWKLLSLVQQDRIFSDAAERWVNGIVRTVGVGWVLLAATAPYFYWFAEEDDAPGVVLIGAALGLIATAALLLMLVLRELLRRATVLRTEIDEVI